VVNSVLMGYLFYGTKITERAKAKVNLPVFI